MGYLKVWSTFELQVTLYGFAFAKGEEQSFASSMSAMGI
jgi:hypothetical protein